LVLHGPNLNQLGSREPDIYGTTTLEAINRRLQDAAAEAGATLALLQSNHEGELIDHIHTDPCDGILINAGGLSHTSVALRDALVDRVYVEVHLSNIAARERFRRTSLLSAHARGVVFGFGADSYILGLLGLLRALE
jgi:3-dehydroquinate dehydratase-2